MAGMRPGKRQEVMVRAKDRTTGDVIWLVWGAATTLGFTAAAWLGLLAFPLVGETAASLIFGLVAGFAQWLLLRYVFPHAGWWIPATALGISLGFATTRIFYLIQQVQLAGLLCFGMAGLLSGIAQWLVLRQHIHGSGWWIPASTIGWVGGGYASFWFDFLEFEKFFISASFAMLGLCLSACTGVLFVLLRNVSAASAPKKEDRKNGLIASCLALTAILMVSVIENLPLHPGSVPAAEGAPTCSDLPPLDCSGSAAFCAELVPFEPVVGSGYVNHPQNGETWDDQYRSYLRRDLLMMVQYAAARVACLSAGWEVAPYQPLGLGDMSEADGAIPGTSIGEPAHPFGTHTDGFDIDAAYFQLDAPVSWIDLLLGVEQVDANVLTYVCKHTLLGVDVYRCTEAPILLDPWRTALFIAALAESPDLRVVGVDGQIGPMIVAALDELAAASWIDPALRARIPLAYETTDRGIGWYVYHHHHLHISLGE